MKRELERHGIKKKVLFISNGVDLKKFRPVKVRKTGKTLLHVGRIGYEKNIDVILKAFKLLLKKDSSARLVIAGRGPDLEKLKSYARRLGIDKSTRFLGPVAHDSLPKLYSSADVFVTASTIETEGLVILEAMACGLPIVGVDALAVPYIVKHGKNGFVAKPYKTKEIAVYMKKLLGDAALRSRFGKESLKIVKRFSLESTVDEFERTYKSLRSVKDV
jgi:glycosyltransferase involved in cell wall biosynthesis